MFVIRISEYDLVPVRVPGWIAIGLVILGVSLSARPAREQSPLERYEYRQTRMGMPVRVVLYAPNDTTARRAGHAAFRLMQDLENILSSYRSSSELNRLSQQSGNGSVPVSDPLFTVLRHAQRLARQSDGAFDITAGPYFDLWSAAREQGTLPDSAALQRASERVGWTHVQLNDEPKTARLRVDSMQLNVGGIAKGYILDRALDTLSSIGISRAMIEAGGDLVLSGPPPAREGWRIRLPGAGPNDGPRTVQLAHAAVSTSGNTEQFVEIDGTRYSHIVDPRTGVGLTHHLLVTVVADCGTIADGLSTTVGVLGKDEGRAFLTEHYPSTTAYLRRSAPARTSD